MKKLANNVLVVGLGRSGKAAALLLIASGCRTSLYDGRDTEEARKFARENGCEISFGERPAGIEGFDMLVLSPGVPTDKDFVKEAAEKGAEVIGELELAYRACRGRFIAITGTNGKTTTTALTGEIFKAAGRDTVVAGNIGDAVTGYAAGAGEDTWMVTECSSFQLETVKHFRPVVSAILNITPDHLDRHKTMENYAAAKANVFKNQTASDYFVFNYDDELTRHTAEKCRARLMPFSRREELGEGAFVKDGRLVIRHGGILRDICGRDELLLFGEHNTENALAAAAAAFAAGIGTEVISETLRSFKGVEHRIEDCGTVDGVRFVNDSKGTNPDASIKAVLSFKDILLIAGGYDKNAEYSEFVNSFAGRVKGLILMGDTARKIKEAAEGAGFKAIYTVKDMKAAVNKAWELSSEGDTVLLSPACASWDMYDNFETRGRDFKNCVQALKGGR